MKLFSLFRTGFAGVVLAWTSSQAGAAELPEDAGGEALITEASRVVKAWHEGEAASGGVLRVVYFYPSDRDPLPDYADRLDRVLNDR